MRTSILIRSSELELRNLQLAPVENEMAKQIVKEPVKLFTNQLQNCEPQTMAAQISSYLTFEPGNSTQLNFKSLQAQLLESKIQRTAKNFVILMSLNVNQAHRRSAAGCGGNGSHFVLVTSLGQWAKQKTKNQK